MRQMATLCLLLCLITSVSFGEVGLISDPDGYINIHEKASLNSKILSKIYKDQVFQYETSESEKWHTISFNEVCGYILRRKVISINTLPLEKIRKIIFDAYQKQNDLLKGKIELSEAENSEFSDVYSVALELVGEFVAKNKDEELLNLHFENYFLETEYCGESYPTAVGIALLIAPEFVCNQALKTGDKEVFNMLKFGLILLGAGESGKNSEKIKAADIFVEAIKDKF